MKLAKSSHVKLQTFFREFLSDENFTLPIIHFYAGRLSRIFTLILNVHGITFGRRIFIMPELISNGFENRRTLSLELAAHEVAHVLQYRKVGFARFFYKYLTDYRKNLGGKNIWNFDSRHEAYLEISFEKEARQIAAAFVEWNKNKKFTE